MAPPAAAQTDPEAPPIQLVPWSTIVNVRALHAVLHHPDLVVVDCRHDLTDPERGARHYDEGHIPGAVHAHVDRDLSAPITHLSGRHPLPEPDAFRDTMGRLGIDADKQVVAYDDVGGAYAARLWWLLRHYGHKAVAVLDGGMPAWTEGGHGIQVGPEENPSSEFHGGPGHLPTVDAASILRRIEGASDNGPVLLDARAPERYRGDKEPIDPHAGHIPGARNAPYAANLDARGRFLAPDELRTAYEALLGDTEPGSVAVYCGSGVTAAHGLLALELAGMPGAALYPGSWSAWCADPSRPIETGDAETGDLQTTTADA